MSLEDAEDIVRMEFESRGIEVLDRFVENSARMFYRGFLWPYLHPFQARREGYRFMLKRLD